MKDINIEEKTLQFLKSQKFVTIGLSMGKDSLACAVLLKKLNIDFLPFYFYHIPELEFVNEQIKFYENYFDKKIIQMPHPMLYDNLRHQDFMPKNMADDVSSYHLPKMEFETLMKYYMIEMGINTDYYDVVGMRASESFNRRKFFEKLGKGYSEKKKKIYPIYNWNKKQVLDFLKENQCPLSNDYPIWNRSFDGLKYQFLFGVKENYPQDFEKIKEYFPLIEADLYRYEFNLGY
jgi:3'-phosphoadenosine 5'-phosphosulfate sulfotransferase (PAPS reductase)/FAD synthetase